MKAAVFLSLAIGFSGIAQAMVSSSHRHEAGSAKSGHYATEGFFVGGEQTVTAVSLKDIRRAKSKDGVERIVLDLKSNGDDSNAIPYFQLQAAPQEGRFVLSLWSEVTYDFNARRIAQAFKKSSHIKSLNILPRVEDGLAIIEFVTHPSPAGKKTKFEAFYLTHPSRITIDLL